MPSIAGSVSNFGFLRVGISCPECHVADPRFNSAQISKAFNELHVAGCAIALTPELGLSAYTIGDLVYQNTLLDKVLFSLGDLIKQSVGRSMLCVVGAPLRLAGGQLYNCAVAYSNGIIRGVVPKTFLPNTGEFYDGRFFSSGRHSFLNEISLLGQAVPFGTDLLFYAEEWPDVQIGIEICEDLWVVEPPSGKLSLAGANLLLNLSASNEILGKFAYRRDLVRMQSARCVAAYVYVSSGPGESSSETVFSGYGSICENGLLLGELNRYNFSTSYLACDIDIDRLVNERAQSTSFRNVPKINVRRIAFPIKKVTSKEPLINRQINRYPFIPFDADQRSDHCSEIFSIQVAGLTKRLKHVGSKRIVIGISGGLDSTLALLVACKTVDAIGLDRSQILAVQMPGLGTTSRTHENADSLSRKLNVTQRNVDICKAIYQHFEDINHPVDQYDVVYENSQARERTQILMDVANAESGIVLGTGDLSESALGWCTFNGDHMSMYHVNIGVPKTLVKHLVQWCASSLFDEDVGLVLRDICDTPISPELLPADIEGTISQMTEITIGPYILNDFFLYYSIRHQFSPKKILFLATQAFQDEFSKEELVGRLKAFYRRFFSNQFKRSSMPDGPKIGSVALSPRSDWRMPSDASVNAWIQEIEDLDWRYSN